MRRRSPYGSRTSSMRWCGAHDVRYGQGVSRICEDCGDGVSYRRYRCPHLNCNLLLCGHCFSHEHGCWPGHSPKTCWDLHPELRPAGLHYHTQVREVAGVLRRVVKHCVDDPCQRTKSERLEVETLEKFSRIKRQMRSRAA